MPALARYRRRRAANVRPHRRGGPPAGPDVATARAAGRTIRPLALPFVHLTGLGFRVLGTGVMSLRLIGRTIRPLSCFDLTANLAETFPHDFRILPSDVRDWDFSMSLHVSIFSFPYSHFHILVSIF